VPKVSEFVQNDAETVVKVGKAQVPVWVRYRPSEITSARIEQMGKREQAGDATAFAQMLEEVLIEWDIEGKLEGDVPVLDEDGNSVLSDSGNELFERKILVEDGDIIPIDANYLKFMSTPMLGYIWRELVSEQAAPDPPKSRGSRRR
jgi:hypothetical protein